MVPPGPAAPAEEGHGPAAPLGPPQLRPETPWQWWWRNLHGLPRPTQLRGRNAWQEQVLARCHLLRAGWAALNLPADADGWQQQATVEFAALVQGAEDACALRGPERWWPAVTGAAVERGWSRVHAAEAMLVAMLPPQQASLVSARVRDQVATHLPKDSAVARQLAREQDHRADGRRQRDQDGAGRAPVGRTLERLLLGRDDGQRPGRNGAAGGGTDLQPGALALALLSARDASGAEHVRMRSYRNMVYLAALVLTFAVALLVALAGWMPEALPTCADPAATPCVKANVPDFGAVLVLAGVGAAAGVSTGVFSLRRTRGTSVPYSVPAALWLLKAPAGAMSAVLGVLLLRSIPALDDFALTSQETVLGWAVVFGASQQLLTRLVDRQAQTLLRAVRSGSRKHPKRPHNRRRRPGPHGRGGHRRRNRR